MDEAIVEKDKLSSWTTRIAVTACRQERRSIAALIKPAALLAAASGRLDLVEGWLQHIPAELIERDPQLLYWSGTTLLMKRPADAQHHLTRAFEMFVPRKQDNWVLLAWAGILDAIFFHYRDLRELDPWIEWMTPERESLVDKLPRMPKMLVVSSMLFALAFRQPNHSRIVSWRERAERLFEFDSTSDLGARLATGLIANYTWQANLAAAEVAWKRFCAHESRARLSPLATVLKHLNEAILCLHQGRLDQCRKAVERGLEASAEHGIHLWDSILHCHAICAFCSREDTIQARYHITAVEQLFAEGIPIDEAYYRAVLFWSSFVEGDHIGALSRCASALELADAKGVPYLQAVCRIGAALTLFEAGHRERGLHLLEEGVTIGREIGNPMLAWVGGLFRAHMEYAKGNYLTADTALENAMRLGRDHSLANFFCWPRRIIEHLIDRALERNYSPDYARFLISRHALKPGALPTRSDRWEFEVRIYTFGDPRIEYADGRVQPLSVQFQRQIELLAALIGNEGRSNPLHAVAADVYPDDDVEVIGSIKRILHSLRERIGNIIIQQHAALSLDFSKVWIDACSFQRLRRDGGSATVIEAWLRQYYQGQFLDCVENSEIVLGVRRRLQDQVERSLRDAYALRLLQGDDEALRQFEAQWQHLFPSVLALSRIY